MRQTVIILLLSCAAHQAAIAQLSGELDQTFHADGIAITDFPDTPWGDASDYGYAIVLQPDGKVVVAGKSIDSYEQTALVRYLPNGELDSGFGTDGRVTTQVGLYSSRANAVALQADGRIVIAGKASDPCPSCFGIARYMPDGTLDNSFDADGIRQESVIIATNEATAVAIQQDGKIVVAGTACQQFAVVRYNTDGSLDNTFAGDGIQLTYMDAGVGSPTAVVIQPDGYILVAGYSVDGDGNSVFALLRYRPNGILDASFGVGGIVMEAFETDREEAFAMALQPDGRILLAGRVNTYPAGSQYGQAALARYLADGTPDPTFGGDGFLMPAVGGQYSRANAITLAPNGRILIAGTNETSSMLAVMHPDGTLDTDFSTDGVQTTSLGLYTWGQCIALQPDGRILVGGTVNINTDPADFFVLRYFSNLNVGILEFGDHNAAPLIYPNPIAESTTLRFALKESTHISILLIDAQGRVVQRFVESRLYQAGDHQLTLPFSDGIAPASYVLSITSPEGEVAVRVVKE